jgi:lipooligosaccharide transport system permease protein
VRQAEYFNFFLSGIIFPAELMTGAFFPVSRLPDFIEPVAWIVPLTSLVDLTRDMMLSRLDGWSLLELGYILATTILFLELALRFMRKRLIS